MSPLCTARVLRPLRAGRHRRCALRAEVDGHSVTFSHRALSTLLYLWPVQKCVVRKHALEPPRGHSRPKIQRGTRCAYQFWPQSARSAASARARPAAWPAAGQAARARARIQQNSARASSQISEFKSCMHEILLHACTTGWTTTRIWTRLPNAASPCKFTRRPLIKWFSQPTT